VACELGAVRIDALGAAEMEGERRVVFVPRAEIVRIEAAYGSAAERPLITALLGLILVGIAGLPVVMLINWWRYGGTYPVKAIAAAGFIVPATWLLDVSLRRRWFIRVVGARGARKLLLPREIEQAAVESFVAAVRTQFGY